MYSLGKGPVARVVINALRISLRMDLRREEDK